jgi:hypothetical protein
MEASTAQPESAEPTPPGDPVAPEPQNATVTTAEGDGAKPGTELEPATASEGVKGEVLDFDVDLDAPAVLKVRLGGRPFDAIDMTLKAQKQLIRTAIEEGKDGEDGDGDVDEDDSDKDVLDAIQSLRSLDTIYPQVAECLTHADGDEKGQPPSREFVEENLRISTFGALMRALARREGKGSKA